MTFLQNRLARLSSIFIVVCGLVFSQGSFANDQVAAKPATALKQNVTPEEQQTIPEEQTRQAQQTSQKKSAANQANNPQDQKMSSVANPATNKNENNVNSSTKALTPTKATTTVGSRVTPSMDASAMIFSLLLVLLAIVGLALFMKKFNFMPTQQAKGIKVITSHHLGSKEKLVVIEVNKQQHLIGVTAQQINLLATLDEPITDPSNEKVANQSTNGRLSGTQKSTGYSQVIAKLLKVK